MFNIRHSLFQFCLTLHRRLTLSLLLFLYVSIAFGQDFEIAPAKLTYNCEPGQIETKMLTIRNHANQKQQFILVTADVKFDSIKKDAASKSCKDWITINPPFLDINPNESKEVKVVMQVPPGESHTRGAMIYISATEEQTAFEADKQMKSAVKVKPRIGVKVIQSPRSNTNYKGSISNLKEITQAKDTARIFQALVSNTGDKMIDGKIYLVLSNLETAKEIKQKPKKVSLFPGTSKTVTMYLSKAAPVGKYSVAAIFDYGNNATLEAVQMNIEIK
jgi:P pilus assembly chaperone PapD